MTKLSESQWHKYRVLQYKIDALVQCENQEIADREIRQDIDSLLVCARNILQREINATNEESNN